MRISFIVNEVAGGWEPTDTRLGGTEEAVVKWAEEFVKQGHDVMVCRNGRLDDLTVIHNDVVYVARTKFMSEDFLNGMPMAQVTINVKSSDIKPRKDCKTIYVTNETNASDLDLSAFDAVVWPSHWAKSHIPVNNNNVFVVPHGYDPERIKPCKKILKQCLYASSPDRGLDFLLGVWATQVHPAHPDATLIVTYGAKGLKVPGVTFLGDVDEGMMDELYATSDVWAYPCNGGELYCITGIKAQAAACVPVIIPTMALSETVPLGYMATQEDYGETLVKALNDNKGREHIRNRLFAQRNYELPTYQNSANSLMQVIKKLV